MRVLIARLGSMGDVIHALPAVAALRAAHPDAHIGWAIERRWTPLLVADENPLIGCPTLAGVARVGDPRSPQRPLVDAVHVVNTLAWREAPLSDETWAEVRNAFRTIRDQHYDIAIDFQGSIKSAVVARFSGAPTRLGFAQPREKPAAIFYTATVRTDARHVIDQNLALASLLIREAVQSEIRNQKSEIPSRSFAPFAVDLFPFDAVAAVEIEKRIDGISHFAILTPGAGWGAKQWPPARYGEVAAALRADGLVSIINYAPGEESLAHEVEAASDGAARPIFCTLSELIALTRRAALFVGGDTGPMHLANALGIPVVALFGPTDPARTGPYGWQSKIENQKSKMVSGWPTLAGFARVGNSVALRHPSSVTDTRHRPEPDSGLLQISADQVISAARDLLASQPDSQHQTPDGRKPTADSRGPRS